MTARTSASAKATALTESCWVRGFERLTPESRYQRFLAPMPELSEEMVRHLTEIDHHDHEAIIALDEESREGIGVARYIRNPQRHDVAEVAVTVIDEWQRKGVGTLLLDVISARAREQGITTFTALMLATNNEMMDLLKRLGPVRVGDQEAGTVEIEVPIPAIGLAPALRKLLRIAARNKVATRWVFLSCDRLAVLHSDCLASARLRDSSAAWLQPAEIVT
jgi:GNAT superfamily N-acetyltransferase